MGTCCYREIINAQVSGATRWITQLQPRPLLRLTCDSLVLLLYFLCCVIFSVSENLPFMVSMARVFVESPWQLLSLPLGLHQTCSACPIHPLYSSHSSIPLSSFTVLKLTSTPPLFFSMQFCSSLYPPHRCSAHPALSSLFLHLICPSSVYPFIFYIHFTIHCLPSTIPPPSFHHCIHLSFFFIFKDFPSICPSIHRSIHTSSLSNPPNHYFLSLIHPSSFPNKSYIHSFHSSFYFPSIHLYPYCTSIPPFVSISSTLYYRFSSIIISSSILTLITSPLLSASSFLLSLHLFIHLPTLMLHPSIFSCCLRHPFHPSLHPMFYTSTSQSTLILLQFISLKTPPLHPSFYTSICVCSLGVVQCVCSIPLLESICYSDMGLK